MSGSFVHLHCHSHYSLLDGASSIGKLISRAKERGMNALALTDHGNLHGALEFYKKAKDAGINPIIGYEAYVAPKSRFSRGDASSSKEAAYHLTLLAKNRTGFKNLIKLASKASLEGFYFKPRIDRELLAELNEGMIASISRGMGAILILMAVGALIGAWIIGGIVPTMIYYGLKVFSPGAFLFMAVIICSVVSLGTGSSWGTIGTVGVALMGVGEGLGVPLPMVAGAIVSGAYFGDKMSPLSDTTNLAPAVAGTDLFTHIRHMVYTTTPSYLLTLVFFGLLGLRFAGQDSDAAELNRMLGRDMFLELWVKVVPNWRRKEALIRRMGYRKT